MYRPRLKELNIVELVTKKGFSVDFSDNYLYFGEIYDSKKGGFGV